MKKRNLVWLEFKHRRSQLVSGLLAITLGIAVIVGIRSVAIESEKAVAIKLDNLGANILVLPQAASVDDYYTADIDAPTMPQDYVDRIMTSNIQGVDNLSPKLTRRVDVNGQKVVLTGIIPKNEISSKPLWQQSGLLGNAPAASCAPTTGVEEDLGYKDEKLQRKVIESLGEDEVLVGSAIADKLKLKTGSKLTIKDQEFKVINILNETGTVDDDRVFANLKAVQGITGIENQVSAIEIMGCCKAISEGLLGQLRNILPDTKITTIGQIVNTQIETNQMMNRISVIFLFIILFVGGISIGNFMWANVNERKKEIGTLRMIGFTRANIYYMLMYKAVILGIIGGIAGYIVGTAAGMVLGPQLAGLKVNPMPELILISMAISIGVTIIGSLIPAYLAGKIEPFSNMQEE